MYCPVCKDKELVISERQSIEIDYCPACRGVWLDRGELDKIIQLSTREPEHRSGQQEHASKYYDNRHRPKKKESFWQELFD